MLAFRILSEAGPDGSLSWLLLWVLGFFFLIIVVGWAASGNKGSGPDSGHEAHEHPHKAVDEPIKSETKGPKLKKKQRK